MNRLCCELRGSIGEFKGIILTYLATRKEGMTNFYRISH